MGQTTQEGATKTLPAQPHEDRREVNQAPSASETRLTVEKQADEMRARLTAIVECSDEAIVEETLDRQIQTWNGGAERLYGYSFAEVRGRDTSSLLSPGRSAEAVRPLRTPVPGGSSSERDETQHRRKDGTWVDVSIGVGSIRDYRGQEVGRCFTARDITSSKTAERLRASLKEKEVLLKEVHHRVKNNLQVISSLLNLQARHLNDPAAREIFNESQNRVLSIALVHEKLYQSADLSHIDFAEYVAVLVDNLLHTHDATKRGIVRELELGGTRLTIDLAIPCGLIITELITNCMKHASRR